MTNRSCKTGASREQATLLPPRVEDYVDADNPVRAIEAYVEALDLVKLGFRHAERGVRAGQPPYAPSDLLKLYLYGYLNRVRSSRRLACETKRNLELIWLLRGLAPGYRTVSTFRAENWAALKSANRDFVVLLRQAGLVGGELVAIDGAFFDGNASKGSIKSQKRLARQLAAIDRELEAYRSELDANDAAEERSGGGDGGGGDLAGKITALMAKRTQVAADLQQLEDSGETQRSRTDPDARLLTKRGETVAGYNVQVAVDEKHKLIVASEVVNDGNDTGQLHLMAKAAKEAVAAETLQALADVGYFNSIALKSCEEAGIVAYVPQPERGGRLDSEGRFGRQEFTYEAEADVYRCPAGQALRPSETLKRNNDRMEIRYTSRKPACDACPLRVRCITDKQPTRTIRRWEHEDVLDRHRERMEAAGELMRRRSGLVEHPFGTLKCRAGYRHFLVRGFNKVRGEWSLMALCYNFTRALNILGLDAFTRLLRALLRAWNEWNVALRLVRSLLALGTREKSETPTRAGLRWRLAT
jgi:transposase